MEKRYQVFVSSTFADLTPERNKIITTLMKMDCIPAGMELFPAIDEDQWNFITRVIDDCDYYILMIGGRYGSITAEGVKRGVQVAVTNADHESVRDLYKGVATYKQVWRSSVLAGKASTRGRTSEAVFIANIDLLSRN